MKKITAIMMIAMLALVGCSKEEPKAASAAVDTTKLDQAAVEKRMANKEYRSKLEEIEMQNRQLHMELSKYEGKTDDASKAAVESIERRLADLQKKAREVIQQEISK